MNSRRMEAEVVRDSLLAVSGRLDRTMQGPELDEKLGQTSARRSLYFRTTPDNQMELLQVFDVANPNACYRRRESVVPGQALALCNSPLAQDQSRRLAGHLWRQLPPSDSDMPTGRQFVIAAFERILTRRPIYHTPLQWAWISILTTQTSPYQAVDSSILIHNSQVIP